MHLVVFLHIDDVLWLVIDNLLLIKVLNCTNTDSPPSQYFNTGSPHLPYKPTRLLHKCIFGSFIFYNLGMNLFSMFQGFKQNTFPKNTNKGKLFSFYAFSLHLPKEFYSLHTTPILCIPCNHCSPQNIILFMHSIKHLLRIQYTTTLDIHINKGTTHRSI